MRITDINNDFLNWGSILNMFYLLNNETPHDVKMKLVKLLEQTVNADMFRSRVFNELSHEILPFIEKYFSKLPNTVAAINEYIQK